MTPNGCRVASVKIPQQLCLKVGPTSSLEPASTFSVAVDKNVHSPLCLESVTSTVPQITW